MATTIVEVTVVFLILITFTVFFEFSVFMVTRLMKKYKVSLTYISSIFRELTLLGLISFILFVVASQSDLSEHRKHVIEQVHMTLFLSSIFFIILVVLIGITFFFWNRRFHNFERSLLSLSNLQNVSSDPNFDSRGSKDSYLLLQEGDSSGKESWLAKQQIVEKRKYLRIREWAILKHSLDRNFPYYRYLKKESSHIVIHLIEIDLKVWVCVALVLLLGTLIDTIAGHLSPGAVVSIIMGVEYSIFLMSLVLWLKITDVVNKIVELPLPIDASGSYASPEEERVTPIDDLRHDRKVKRSLKRNVKKTLLPWRDPELRHNRTAGFFWLRSRGLFRGLIQIVILSQAIYMAYFAFQGYRYFTSAYWFSVFVVILPVPFIVLVFVPFVLPAYLVASQSGDYFNRKHVRRMLEDDAAQKERDNKEKDIKVVYLSDEEDDHSAVFLPEHGEDH